MHLVFASRCENALVCKKLELLGSAYSDRALRRVIATQSRHEPTEKKPQPPPEGDPHHR